MNHEPVAIVIAWLKSVNAVTASVSGRIASMFAEDALLPAIAVTNSRGAPVATAGGIDTVYDWQITVYALAGKTGRGSDFPDYQTASAVAANIVTAVRTIATTNYVSTSGAKIIDAEVFSMTRTENAMGDATVIMTLDIRVAD